MVRDTQEMSGGTDRRDPKDLSPHEAAEAAKAKLRDSLRRVKEELSETGHSLQAQVVGTAGQLQDKVVGTVSEVQGKLSETLGEVQGRVSNTLEDVQGKVSHTLDDVQGRFKATGDHIGARVGEIKSQVDHVVEKPREVVRGRPLEAVAVAAAAGLLLGLLTSGGRSKGYKRASRKAMRGGSYARPDYAQTGRSTQAAEEEHHGGMPPMLTAIAASGVGKMVWDTIQREYLTPENVRGFIDSLIGGRAGRRSDPDPRRDAGYRADPGRGPEPGYRVEDRGPRGEG